MKLFSVFCLAILTAMLAIPVLAEEPVKLAPVTMAGPVAAPPPLPAELHWQGLVPGSTLPEEIIKALGEPRSKETYEDGAEGWQYNSCNSLYPHELIIEKGKLTLAARYADEKKRESLTARISVLGQPEAELFTFYAFHYKVFVWATRGYLAIADNEKNIIEEQWFPPQPAKEFVEQNKEKFPHESPYVR